MFIFVDLYYSYIDIFKPAILQARKLFSNYSGIQNSGARIQNGLGISRKQLADFGKQRTGFCNIAILEIPGQNQTTRSSNLFAGSFILTSEY
jgi:hypothetical protein